VLVAPPLVSREQMEFLLLSTCHPRRRVHNVLNLVVCGVRIRRSCLLLPLIIHSHLWRAWWKAWRIWQADYANRKLRSPRLVIVAIQHPPLYAIMFSLAIHNATGHIDQVCPGLWLCCWPPQFSYLSTCRRNKLISFLLPQDPSISPAVPSIWFHFNLAHQVVPPGCGQFNLNWPILLFFLFSKCTAEHPNFFCPSWRRFYFSHLLLLLP